MDFLKSCRPNLYTLGDISMLRYTTYAPSFEHGKSKIGAVLRALREGGILCAQQDAKVVVYHPNQAREESDLERVQLLLRGKDLKLVQDNHDTPENTQDEGSAGQQVETLQDAIDAAIGHSLTRDAAVKRLAPRTWLFCDDTNSCRVLAQLRFHLTSANVLYCATVFDNVDWASYDATKYGEHVLICPLGVSAETVAPSHPGIVATSLWKKSVTEWLESEIGDGADHDDWAAIRLPTGDHMVWPSHLLVRKQSAAPVFPATSEWKQWFTGAEELDGFISPLSFAADWYKGASDRENQVEASQPVAEQPAASTAPADATPFLATSPPFIQRLADQQAAMSGIYPTPPDGLVQASQLQVQQDSVMHIDTGPSNPEVAPALTEQTPNAQNEVAPVDRDGFDQEARELFGDDIGTMDFAGDIGDADFSFFDEPDEAADDDSGADVVMQDVADEDEGATVPNKDTEHTESFPEDTVQQSPPADPQMEQTESKDEQPEESNPEKDHDEPPELEQPQLQEKPLSPFGIKERLLPPPIPASAMHGNANRESQQHNRRNSTFEPVTFRDGLDLGTRYTSQTAYATDPRRNESRPGFDISLPPRRKKPRVKAGDTSDDADSDETSDSEDDSFDSDSSMSDENMPPKLPWDTKKRKRPNVPDSFGQTDRQPRAEDDDHGDDRIGRVDAHELLDRLRGCARTDRGWADLVDRTSSFERIGSPTDLFDLSKMDTMYVAQIIGDQAMSAVLSLENMARAGNACEDSDKNGAEGSLQQTTDAIFVHQLCARHVPDLGSIALIKEPPQRPLPAPGQPRPGVPRPHQRTDSAALGPDLFSIPPPYVKLRRGTDQYELLPPALAFWETLGLGPTSGQKDVRAYCVFPWNEELQKLVDGFLGDMGTAYESCKLGSHVHVRNVDEELKLDDYEDGLAPVELNGDSSLDAVLKAFQTTCSQLGTFLANVGQEESNRTLVIYMINPFSEPKAAQFLCTCFWLLCKAYRDNAPKTHKKMSRSDIVLQLVPIGMVASNDAPVIPSPNRMVILAREVYDRCPPSPAETAGTGTALRCVVAPAVELAEAPPKRIGFQLSPDPPSDLMHEGSALHLSCAISRDGLWLVAAWIDMTGRYQRTQAFSFRGKTLGNAIEDVWDRTKEILQSREVFWRVFILLDFDLDSSVMSSWRKTTEKPRKQPFSVTLTTASADPVVRVLGPLAAVEDAPSHAASGFLTPATTPGGSALTLSPEANQSTAPPTPAPSESIAAAAENDPEAHFVDLQDETWGMLFSQNFAQTRNEVVKPLITGAIYKRGCTGKENEPQLGSRYLPALHVRLYWTMQVRPNGNVDDGHVKQAEMTLRELLRMYRNLNVLTQAKELVARADAGGDPTAWPIHLVAARKAAVAVNGLLK